MEQKQPTIAEIDPNLAVKGKITQNDVVFYHVKNEPFDVYGLYDSRAEGAFRRMPEDVARATNGGVLELHTNTAGGRIRFTTDSPYVAVHVAFEKQTRFSHMAFTGIAGFDLYEDDALTGHSRHVHTFVPPYDTEHCYESIKNFGSRRTRHFTLHMPLYNNVDELLIGLAEGSSLSGGLAYRDVPPVVYYGSSITQGGCVSRPGNCYSNVVTMRTGIDHLNLGFSGSARAELAVVEYMAGLAMSAFISDYDHNARSADMLRDTHERMYRIIRERNPEIPYIIISRADFTGAYEDSVRRRDVIYETYRRALADGDKNVHFIDGEGVYRGHYREMATVDGCHPNDLGSALMADAIEKTLLLAFARAKEI